MEGGSKAAASSGGHTTHISAERIACRELDPRGGYETSTSLGLVAPSVLRLAATAAAEIIVPCPHSKQHAAAPLCGVKEPGSGGVAEAATSDVTATAAVAAAVEAAGDERETPMPTDAINSRADEGGGSAVRRVRSQCSQSQNRFDRTLSAVVSAADRLLKELRSSRSTTLGGTP